MKNNPEKRRRSIRLTGYNYMAPGAYFVTLCTQGGKCTFGKVSPEGKVTLNSFGGIASEEWRRSMGLRAEVDLDAFVVMPNHIHGVVVIKHDLSGNSVGGTGQSPQQRPDYPPRGPVRRSLASFIVGYKGAVTRRINALRKTPRALVWQRNYYERVLRDGDELKRARFYIRENPARWADDDYNPAAGPARAEAATAVFR